MDFKALVEKGAIILDVRTGSEFAAGHIANSENIPLDKLPKFVQVLKEKQVPIITCCRSGNRSGMAKSLLEQAGIEAYNGGAWDELNHLIQ
ncbi:MAG: rhodanese-like domain-containing protein [Bacteroidia bacterium]|nr:rhodanese-like domain-containing protein [Bacteroidia bacterium]